MGACIRSWSFRIVPRLWLLDGPPPIADFGQTVTLSLWIRGPNQVIFELLGNQAIGSSGEKTASAVISGLVGAPGPLFVNNLPNGEATIRLSDSS